jgi:ComF family protein
MFTWFQSFIDLIFPNTCLTCHQNLLKNEKYVCLSCLYDLAFLYDYKNPNNNKIYYQIVGFVPIQGAFAGFRFDKGGKLQTLLHHLKYYRNPDLGVILGEFLSKQIPNPFSKHATLIPIPLHQKKLKKRGYNQAQKIAEGIAKNWHLPINSTDFVRTVYTETQTFKTKHERQQNVENIFQVVKPIHSPIILVDDVITTGSTLVSACKTLYENGTKEIYVITVAAADY